MPRYLPAVLLALGTAPPAPAYIAALPTLGKVTRDAPHVVVLRVDKVSREKQVVIFSKVADLKGTDAPDVVKHKLTDGSHPRQAHMILDWAEPGQIAVCFHNEKVSVTCIGAFWYECAAAEAPWWTMTVGRPELSYAYSGSTARLRDHVTAIVAGRETVVTALKFRLFKPGGGATHLWDQWDSVEAVGSRRLMRGKDWPLWRIKAGLKTPNTLPELIRIPELLVGDGPGGPADVPALVKALAHEEARARAEAAEDLALIGGPARDALPALRKVAQGDPEPLTRLVAARAVAAIDPKSTTAIPALIEALEDRSGKVRKKAAECLGDLGSGGKAAVGALVKAMGDSDPAVSWAAMDALGQIGPDAEPAVPGLVGALKEPATRGAAVDALGQIGRKAQPAIVALEKVLKGDDAALRWAAASALVRIGGSGVKAGTRYLLETASRNYERNWSDANNILQSPASREALPVMLDAVRDPAIRQIASVTALELSAYLTKDPLTDVKPLLKDRDAGVRCVTAWALHTARAVEMKDAIAVLRETLKATDPWARQHAARFLGKLGPSAKDAADDLAALLEDKDEGVRKAAAEALKSVRGK
jgi:HEAT repeat protein